MTFHLRDYQTDCLEAIRFGHQEHDSIAIELATGLGKTICFTRYAKQWNQFNMFDRRAMVIAPQITLIGQAAKKIYKETGQMPAVEQADQWSNEQQWARSDFIVASKQTLCSNERYKRFSDVGLVIIDEAHYAATEAYAEVLTYFRERGAKVLGVSATLKRHDKAALGQLFDECVYQYGIQDAIADGWLVPLNVTCKQLKRLDLTSVGTANTQFGKDFNTRQLNEKLENVEVIYEIAAAVAEETRGHKTAIFCSSVEEARAVAELLEDQYSIKAGWICADTKKCSKQDREERLRSFTDPDGLTHLANVGILTTGWDYPALECIVMARPTKSLPLFTQIIGRVTRPVEGHQNVPVVDFEGSTAITRQEAIRMSKKPYGRVIDLVDASLKHKIVTTADVLGGRWYLVSTADGNCVCRFCLREFTSSMSLSLHVTSEHPEEAENIQKRGADELKAEDEILNEQLRQQRAARKAEAEFANQQVNPFGDPQSNTRMRSQAVMATDKQRRYLWVLGFKDIDKFVFTKAQAGRMITQFKSGMAAEQVKRLNKLQVKGAVVRA